MQYLINVGTSIFGGNVSQLTTNATDNIINNVTEYEKYKYRKLNIVPGDVAASYPTRREATNFLTLHGYRRHYYDNITCNTIYVCMMHLDCKCRRILVEEKCWVNDISTFKIHEVSFKMLYLNYYIYIKI